MKRVLVLSDTHGNCRALKAVLDRFGSADEIWCLGDIVTWGPSPAGCIDLLRECGARVVQGNHDVEFVGAESLERGWAAWDAAVTPGHVEYLRRLPASLTLELDGATWFLAHGAPNDLSAGGFLWDDRLDTVREKLAGCAADYVVGGHTHVPLLVQAGAQLIVNAGAAGQPEDGDCRAECMVYDNGCFRLERVEYDLEALADDYARCGMPDHMKEMVLGWQRAGIVSLRGRRVNPLSDDPARIIRPGGS